MSLNGLIGRKISMTTFYHEDGTSYPVTVVKLGPCVITQVKTLPRDGYEAVQIGFMEVERINKPLSGHLNRSGGKYKYLREFSSENLSSLEVGQEIKSDLFNVGDKVKVTGISKGKGFSGAVKRYNFRGGPKTHGQSDRHRAVGSIGAGSSPGRVWKGTRMPGHYGVEQITLSGLRIVNCDPKEDIIYVVGSVPGAKNSLLTIEKQK
jgi:large subunit ribosomal protein L3